MGFFFFFHTTIIKVKLFNHVALKENAQYNFRTVFRRRAADFASESHAIRSNCGLAGDAVAE